MQMTPNFLKSGNTSQNGSVKSQNKLSAQDKKDWDCIYELYTNSFCIMSRETQERIGAAISRLAPMGQ